MDFKALNNIGYGLYVITSFDGKKHNGFISNSVMQVSSNPVQLAVSINKQNHSHDVIRATGKMNVNILTEDTPFATFKQFGFQSGRDVDKFAGENVITSGNGLAIITENVNACLCLKVKEYVDTNTHGLFICTLEESAVLSEKETMTYSFYHKNVKEKPKAKNAYVCKICGYVYEGGTLPPDYICPLCKHGAEYFEKK